MKRFSIPFLLFLTSFSLLAADCNKEEVVLCQCGCEENGSDEIPADEDLS
jgi:hypothetical protein